MLKVIRFHYVRRTKWDCRTFHDNAEGRQEVFDWMLEQIKRKKDYRIEYTVVPSSGMIYV